jgi:hypothetical protein
MLLLLGGLVSMAQALLLEKGLPRELHLCCYKTS